MERVGFEGDVAVITGAGGGLGRQHALLLAERGARIVVNDIGGSVDGTGTTTDGPAQQVVDEITALGGEAVADTHSVSDVAAADAIIQTAVDAFGRVDIVVNNAGILRDKAFHNMTGDLVDPVIDVHLKGAINVTRAAWQGMREQKHGRVIMTSSAAGLLGNFGQANYGAAKMGLVGLANVLAIEGARSGITVNTIAPVARTRMTEDLLGPLADLVDPGLVSPLVVWLAHRDNPTTGHIYTVGGGRIARFYIGMTPGWTRTDGQLTPEDVRDHFDEIEAIEGSTVPSSIADDMRALKRALTPRE